MTTYRFNDTMTEQTIIITTNTEDSAWEMLCNKYGTGYVFENIEKI